MRAFALSVLLWVQLLPSSAFAEQATPLIGFNPSLGFRFNFFSQEINIRSPETVHVEQNRLRTPGDVIELFCLRGETNALYSWQTISVDFHRCIQTERIAGRLNRRTRYQLVKWVSVIVPFQGPSISGGFLGVSFSISLGSLFGGPSLGYILQITPVENVLPVDG